MVAGILELIDLKNSATVQPERMVGGFEPLFTGIYIVITVWAVELVLVFGGGVEGDVDDGF